MAVSCSWMRVPPTGQGWALVTSSAGTMEIILNDGRGESRWDCDPGMLQAGKLQHLVVVVDGGPKIISFFVDGVLCDGGDFRQFGWGRFSPDLRHVNSTSKNPIIAPGSTLAYKMAHPPKPMPSGSTYHLPSVCCASMIATCGHQK